MSSEAELVMTIWEVMRDQLPAGKRGDFAKDLLYAVAQYGFEAGDLASILDEDPELTDAYEEVFSPLEEEDLYSDE